MANSGVKIIKTLRKYINGVPTEETKNNVFTDPDYIPNFASSSDCPTGCDSILSGDYLINANSSGSSVYGTTTTTSSTTTTTTTEMPPQVRQYDVSNFSQSNSLSLEYIDEYGATQEQTVSTNTTQNVISQIEPIRTSGSTDYSIEANGVPYTPLLITTTTTLRQSTDYTIDNTASSSTSIVSLTQMGESQPVETEIKAGSSVTVTSDTPVTLVSGSATISSGTTVTPQADQYTLTNNDYYRTATVGYRPWLSTSDEVVITPRGTTTVVSQDVPTVSSSSNTTNVTIAASNNPTQPANPEPIIRRICNQHTLTNDSVYAGSFEYVDCNGQSQTLRLQPGQSATVSGEQAPTPISGGMQNNYSIDTITKDFGNSGSANQVVTSSTTSTTSTTTTTIAVVNTREEIVPNVVKDGSCGKHYYFKEGTQNTDTAPRWYPKTFKISVEDKTGAFEFISYDPGYVPVLYRVYDGQNLLLDKCIVSDENGGKWRSRAYTAFVDAGMSTSDANTYTLGSKTKTPDKLTKRRDYNPFQRKEHTAFTLNKVTRNDYITIKVYEPLHNGLDYAAGISHGAKFEIGCVQ